MTTEHKAALASGRAQGLAVRRYLEALERNRPRRGRRPSSDSLRKQLSEIEEKLQDADPLKRLHLVQQRKIVEAAAEYGSRKGIDYSTWREIGVPVDVLRRAGIQKGASS